MSMPPRPAWWHHLQASKNEALLAVDLYNQSAHERQLEAFIVHMCISWLKIIQARYMRDDGDIFIRDQRGWRQRTNDGDWLHKSFSQLVSEELPPEDARRANIEFFIGLRNKIEHRYDRDIASLVSGKSQAALLNYEKYLETTFGPDEGLADKLRFPLFVSTMTSDAVASIKAVRRKVPKSVLDYVENFDAALSPDVSIDQAYNFSVYLLPHTGPKSSADAAMTFIRMEDFDPEQAEVIDRALTLIREKQVPVSGLGELLPGAVARRVSESIGQRFSTNDHTSAWRYYEVRPPDGSPNPERTKCDFCRYNCAFGRYVYTEAWVAYLTRKMSEPEEYERVTGRAHEVAAVTAVVPSPREESESDVELSSET